MRSAQDQTNRIYLDYAASAPLKKQALEAMQAALAETGNASSVHSYGRAQRQRVENARGIIAARLGIKPAQIIFTASATEANNMVLKGVQPASVAVSSIEHASVVESTPQAQRIKVTKDGIMDLNDLEQFLKAAPKPVLVSLMYVNNETGVIQPVLEAAKLAKAHDATLHCDAVQAFGKISFTFSSLGADAISLSAHKIGGPQGVGALIVRETLALQPFMQGGSQEMRHRAGTENTAAIAGFGAAVETLGEDLARQGEWQGWRDVLEEKIQSEAPAALVFGKNTPRVATITSLSMPKVTAEIQLIAFDLAGIAVSSGSACSSGKVQASHVLKAMDVSTEAAGSAIRVSFGAGTTRETLEKFAEIWIELYQRKQRKAA